MNNKTVSSFSNPAKTRRKGDLLSLVVRQRSKASVILQDIKGNEFNPSSDNPAEEYGQVRVGSFEQLYDGFVFELTHS